MSDIRQRVQATIEKQTGPSVDLDERLRTFDSLDLMQLLVDLEEEFNITISDTEFEKCKSVDELTSYIESLVLQV